MNLFFLDEDVQKSAEYHCDSHCVKIILEATQCLAAALDRWESATKIYSRKGEPYKITHANHPMVRWVGDSFSNFWYTHQYALSLCMEYTHRYKKIHACQSKLVNLYGCDLANIPRIGLTVRPQCFGAGNEWLQKDDIVEAYRLYYNVVKRQTIKMKWTNREEPYWYKNFLLEK